MTPKDARDPKGPRPKRRGDWKPEFLEAFTRSQMVTEACRAARIDRPNQNGTAG